MKLRFFDRVTKADAVLTEECKMFLVGIDGEVVEYLDQGYCSHFDLLPRPDVGIEICLVEDDDLDWQDNETLIKCVNCGSQSLGSCRCYSCDGWLSGGGNKTG